MEYKYKKNGTIDIKNTAIKYGIKPSTLYRRIKLFGMTINDALNHKLYKSINNRKKKLLYKGEKYTSIKEIFEKNNMQKYYNKYYFLKNYHHKNFNLETIEKDIQETIKEKNKENITKYCKRIGVSREWYYQLKKTGRLERFLKERKKK